jgi:hypothetical protein
MVAVMKRRRAAGRIGLAVAVLLAFGGGCSRGGPEIVPIEGVATHNGAPVPNIRIYFAPAGGRPSWAITDEQGRFVLDYDPDHKGALVGTHKVWIIDESANVDPTLAMSGGARPKRSPASAELAAKYSRDHSPLTVEVKRADRNFELKLD